MRQEWTMDGVTRGHMDLVCGVACRTKSFDVVNTSNVTGTGSNCRATVGKVTTQYNKQRGHSPVSETRVQGSAMASAVGTSVQGSFDRQFSVDQSRPFGSKRSHIIDVRRCAPNNETSIG